MIEVHLYGQLASTFGPLHHLEVGDSGEAVRGLCQLSGFRREIESGEWRLIKGPLTGGRPLDLEGLQLPVASAGQLHILPSTEGAGGGRGVGKVLAGAALIGASFIPGLNAAAVPYLMGSGVGMALGGVSLMLGASPGSNYGDRESPDQRPSFLFNGPVNTSTQGLPVPLIYGQIRTGSVVISAGMTAEELEG